jgi:dual specificity phosphatase 12
MGKSRSAAVLAAYLMQSRQLNPDEAIALIRTARPFVDPNQGFMEQLWLFHQMKYTATLDEHPIYQRWLYDVEVKTSIAARRAPERIYFRDEVQRITEITQTVDGEIQEKETKVVELRCRKCRYLLSVHRLCIGEPVLSLRTGIFSQLRISWCGILLKLPSLRHRARITSSKPCLGCGPN